MSDISNKVKKRRLSLGLSQEDLAKKLGYKSKTTINKIESGVNDIPRKKIKDFAVALETTPEYFLDYSNSLSSTSSTKDDNHIVEIDSITYEEETLLFYYRKLSQQGQSIAQERMKELTEIKKYVENNN
ncbi:MAG: helix-turn-helix domain-containing protein [Lachnospiraceae bacterium]|nr:helix-turn-helix domain-containing protein [Lachnospiraceae bacterium]